jgi:hypothetical protein
MTETPEQRRARILSECDTPAWMYDLALALGYEPESWDGMWKLAATPDQFTVRGRYIIAREATGPFMSRLKAHPIPEGWSIIEDHRITEATPRVHIVNKRAYLLAVPDLVDAGAS